MRVILLASLIVLLAGVPALAETGEAQILGTTEGSLVSGKAEFRDSPEGFLVSVNVANVPPGKHGFHIHQFGSCADSGNAAGGHFNPDGVLHGELLRDGIAGAHAGDFGNIEVDESGTGSLQLVLPALSLSQGRYSVGGRAVILHEKEDDFGQPTGNAGGRIGCGTILITS